MSNPSEGVYSRQQEAFNRGLQHEEELDARIQELFEAGLRNEDAEETARMFDMSCDEMLNFDKPEGDDEATKTKRKPKL